MIVALIGYKVESDRMVAGDNVNKLANTLANTDDVDVQNSK